MTTPGDLTELPDGFRLELDPAPTAEIRGRLAKEINDFHSRTVPHESRRFALLVRDGGRELAAGLIGVISWQWLFIEAVWVGDPLRGHGVGRIMMARAETHAAAQGCHSAWLDTFQAREFYLQIGYEVFGVLVDYPPGQSRSFMRKRLQTSLGTR
jgi:GNAT superfamily N-acetyltransferase